jgi:hypothetical protein
MEIKKFVICIDNSEYESSLEQWKVYPVLSEDEIEGYIRVIDESGEDYLYEIDKFEEIEIPQEVVAKYELSI